MKRSKELIKRILGSRLTDRIAYSAFFAQLQSREQKSADARFREFFYSRPDAISVDNHFDAVPANSDVGPLVWQVWLQGWSGAPPIVTAASEISENSLSGREFRRLDLAAISKLQVCSREELELFLSGKVSPSGFVDLVRFRLLEQFGGLYLDATVLLRKSFQIRESFITVTPYHLDSERVMGSWYSYSWMLALEKGSLFGSAVADLLSSYWNSRGKQEQYFDVFWAMGAVGRELNKRGVDFVKNIVISDGATRFMHAADRREEREMFEAFFESPFHKLSWKSPRGSLCTPSLLYRLQEMDKD